MNRGQSGKGESVSQSVSQVRVRGRENNGREERKKEGEEEKGDKKWILLILKSGAGDE